MTEEPETLTEDKLARLLHTQRATARILRTHIDAGTKPNWHSSWADHMDAVADALEALALGLEAECRPAHAQTASEAADALASISEPVRAEEGKEPVACPTRSPADWYVALKLYRDEDGTGDIPKEKISKLCRDLSAYEKSRAAPSSSTLEITEEAVEAGALAIVNVEMRRLDLPELADVNEFRFESDRGVYLAFARAALEASLPFLSQTGGEKSELPADVVELVCAARVVAFENQAPEALKRLDTASDAFADRVPWAGQPEEKP